MAELERAKGTREISPEEKIVSNKIISVLTRNFELFGFVPLETPTLQRFDVLSSKYAGGAEILKETFRLFDQGKRDLALRYDLTVPLALYIALNPNVKLPFKRYEIGKVFRDGPISVERFREFCQCDVDTIGSSSMLAEAELITLAFKIFNELGLENIEIRVNNRKILNSIIKYANIDESIADSVILSIDKLEKIERKGVEKELSEKGLSEEQIEKLFLILSIKGSNQDKLIRLKDLLENNQGIEETEELLSYCPLVTLDLTLARGLLYYTGTIFEVRLPVTKVSIAAGGRYDNMIGDLLDSKTKVPAVGISFGLDRISKFIKSKEKTLVKVYVIPIRTKEKSLELLSELRNNNINSDMDLMNRSISKNLDYANSLSIPYVIFIGEDEVKQNKFKLRDMKTGKEELLNLKDLIKNLNIDLQ